MTESETVLKSVPAEKAFYFYSDIGKYTGKIAASLKDFGEKVRELDEKSLKFHLQRGDFEKWISGVLKDEELTRQLKELRETIVPTDNLRDRISSLVSKRLEQLIKTGKSPSQPIFSPKMQAGRKREYRYK